MAISKREKRSISVMHKVENVIAEINDLADKTLISLNDCGAGVTRVDFTFSDNLLFDERLFFNTEDPKHLKQLETLCRILTKLRQELIRRYVELEMNNMLQDTLGKTKHIYENLIDIKELCGLLGIKEKE